MFTIQWLSDKFSICKLPDLEEVRQKNQFSFLSITDEEISYVQPIVYQRLPYHVRMALGGFE